MLAVKYESHSPRFLISSRRISNSLPLNTRFSLCYTQPTFPSHSASPYCSRLPSSIHFHIIPLRQASRTTYCQCLNTPIGNLMHNHRHYSRRKRTFVAPVTIHYDLQLFTPIHPTPNSRPAQTRTSVFTPLPTISSLLSQHRTTSSIVIRSGNKFLCRFLTSSHEHHHLKWKALPCLV